LTADQQPYPNNGSKTAEFTHFKTTNSATYLQSVNQACIHLRRLQCESQTLNEILQLLKNRLDEARESRNREDLAQLWTKYYMSYLGIKQLIADYATLIATFHFEIENAKQSSQIRARVDQMSSIIDALYTRLESSNGEM
jgi:hypothetical protein